MHHHWTYRTNPPQRDDGKHGVDEDSHGADVEYSPQIQQDGEFGGGDARHIDDLFDHVYLQECDNGVLGDAVEMAAESILVDIYSEVV